MIHSYDSKIKRQTKETVSILYCPPAPATCFPSLQAVSVTGFPGSASRRVSERASEQGEAASMCSYKLLSIFTRGSDSTRRSWLRIAATLFHLKIHLADPQGSRKSSCLGFCGCVVPLMDGQLGYFQAPARSPPASLCSPRVPVWL